MKITSNAIFVFYGQPCSGKSTLAEATKREIYRLSGLSGPIIDGDVIRRIFKNQDYSKEGRIKNLNRISDISVYMANYNKLVFVSAVYPYREARHYLENIHNPVIWVHLIYDGIRGREQYHVKDFDNPLEKDYKYQVEINTSKNEINECTKKICSFYRQISDLT